MTHWCFGASGLTPSSLRTPLFAPVFGRNASTWCDPVYFFRGCIARKALARKTGARGLRSIVEGALIDTMFELPHTAGVAKVVVDENTIEDNQPPLLVYREAAKKA